MHSQSTRALPMPAAAYAALAIFLCALMGTPTASFAQQSGRRTIQSGQPSQINPGRPTNVYPQRQTVVQPARPVTNNPLVGRPIPSRPMPSGTPITNFPVSPGSPGLRPQPQPGYPVRPVPPIAILPPGKPVPPIGIIPPWKPSPPCFLPPPCPPPCPVVVVIPSFPSAFIGPEMVRFTTYPTETDTELTNVPAPVPSQMQPLDPAALQGNEATPRLIAILGRIERVEAGQPHNASRTSVSTSTGRKDGATGDGDQLCIGLGTLTTYFNPDPDQPTEAMARGTYFGSRWDGDTWQTSATGLWSRGPVTRQPLFTLHELQPSAFPFEVALPGRRITSLRMAIALLRDLSPPPSAPSAPRSPTQSSPRSTLPFQSKLRHLTMANNLRRHLQESNEPVPLVPPRDPAAPAPSAGPDPEATYLGNAHSPFGQALAASAQELLATAPLPQPSTVNPQLIGSAEWTLPLSDLRDIMSGCPRFTSIPLPADLQTVRSRDTSPAPLWVRPFRIGSEDGAVTYQGEVWFVIVPDAAIRG